MRLTAIVSSLEVMVPENLYEMPSEALKVCMGCNMRMNQISDYKDIFKRERDGKKTVIESLLKKVDMYINLDLSQLEIFLEKQVQHNESLGGDIELPTRLYLLQPYHLKVDMQRHDKHHSATDSDSSSLMTVTGTRSFTLTLGLKELAHYLTIAQVYFQFSNELTVMQ